MNKAQQNGAAKSRRRAVAAAALLSVAAVTAGCSSSSGPGVASAASATHSAAAGNQQPSQLAYAKCMIGHGITNFPEPNGSGQLQLSQGQQLPDVNSPQFQAAMRACMSLNPAGVGVSPAEQAAQQAALVKYAKCMRSHGVPNFPDPTSNGTFDVGGLNVDSPQLKAADKACSSRGVGLFQPQRAS